MSKKRKNEMAVQVTETVTLFIDAAKSTEEGVNPYTTWSVADLEIAANEAKLRRDNAETDMEFMQEDFTYYLIDTVLKEKQSDLESTEEFNYPLGLFEDEYYNFLEDNPDATETEIAAESYAITERIMDRLGSDYAGISQLPYYGAVIRDAEIQLQRQELRLKKAKFKIQIADMFIPMQDFTLAESNKHYPDHTVVDVTQSSLCYKSPASPIYVDIPKGYNIYTYDSKEYGITEYQAGAIMEFTSFYNITLRLMNLVATGHLITLVTPDGIEYTMGTPSLKFIDVQILNQIEYLTKKYSKITDAFYQQYLIDTFGSVGAARGYFATEDWMEENRILDRYTTLNNLFRDVLMDIQQDREAAKELLRNKQREAEILDLSADLEAALPTITRYDLIPNQDVTAPLSQVINYQVKFEAEQLGSRKEYGSAYFTPGIGLTITESDLMEQAAINAYYYASPEFRVPTEDELHAEYQQLCQEYEDLKALARFNPTEARIQAAAWVDQHVRLLELEEKFNTVVFGEIRYAESLNKKPSSSRYDG